MTSPSDVPGLEPSASTGLRLEVKGRESPTGPGRRAQPDHHIALTHTHLRTCRPVFMHLFHKNT